MTWVTVPVLLSTETVIVKDDGETNDEVKERIAQLQDAHKNESDKASKEFINQRIASLSGGIGVVYVGGNTDLEQKELYDRVDDAVCAVRSALEEGILPGGGLKLYNLHKTYSIRVNDEKDPSKKIAYAILDTALRAPLRQILDNAGLKVDDVYAEAKGDGWGYDVKNERYGSLMELGVIDPVKVTRQALQNAVSVAVTILSTNAIVTMARSYDTAE